MNVLSHVRIAGKLYTLILMAVLALVGLAVTNQYQLGKVFESANYATINTVPSFISIYEVQNRVLKIRISARDHMLNTDPIIMAKIDHDIQHDREIIEKTMNNYESKLISDEEDKRLLDMTRLALKDYYVGLDTILALSRLNKNDEARMQSEKNNSNVAKLEQAIQNHIDYNKKLADSSSAEALATKDDALIFNVTFTSLMLGVLIVFGWVIANFSLARPIGRVAENLRQLAEGRMDVMVDGVGRRDEIGDIARAGQVFKEFAQTLSTQDWVKSNAAIIAADLQQAEDFVTLTQIAVSKIAPLIGAGHGAFYVADGHGLYTLHGSYGFRERKHPNSGFVAGEGLVGQCVLEKTVIMLTVPEDYILINSGLGEGPATCIILLPVIHNDRVLGVLEMASFEKFKARDEALLETLLVTLSASMEILDRNLRTKELLIATQEQAERMEKQAAQLEEQQVEMEAQQAELLETENWFRSIIEAAPDGMLVADRAGQILLSNPRTEVLFGYSSGELIGGNVELLMPERLRGKHAGLRETFLAEDRSRVMEGGPELLGLRKDGTEFPISVSLSPLPPRGNRGKCISVSIRARSVT